jgi:hypothetical protein
VYKKKQHGFSYKTAGSEQAALHELVTISHANQEVAIAIINQSMANGWKGLFQIKNLNNGHAANFNGNGKPPSARERQTEASKAVLDDILETTKLMQERRNGTAN